MKIEQRLKVFELELSLINNPDIREFTEKVIEYLPDYFFTIAASTTRKYHPQFASGEGGLIRHTQAAVRLAKEWFNLEMFNHFSDTEKDLMLASLLLHDGMKAGTIGLHTVTEHPLLMGQLIRDHFDELRSYISKEWMDIVISNIETHMGAWTKDFKTGLEVLEKPNNKMQNFVHLIDYTISRKMMEVNLEATLSE